MKILILSFYYRPDLSACSFRTTILVDSLRRQMPAGSQVDVITTLPNRYHSYSADAQESEIDDGVRITRVALPPHKSGILDQARAFIAFTRGASRAAEPKYDVVFATSSRLMTAVLGAWIARKTHARLYLDLRDIFVDTIADVYTGPIAWSTKPVFHFLERWAVSRADQVNLVSRGFAQYFERQYPAQRFSYYTNGIDDEFLAGAPDAAQEIARVESPRRLTVLYAGNLGEGQGLHAILPALARGMGNNVRFLVVGDGGRKRALELALAAEGITNVELRPPVPRAELVKLYEASDVLFLHLNDYEAFKKVLPSKVFEYAAMGKPVWAGVAGYAAEFIRTEIRNSAVFAPCDVADGVRAFETLALTNTQRPEFLAKYSRASISDAMAAEVLSLSDHG